MRTLDPIPPGSSIRTLTDVERAMLIAQVPSLQSSLKDCRTCSGRRRFRWYDGDEVVDWECNCRDQFVMHRYFLHIGIEYVYQRLGWEDARHVEVAAQEVVLDYAEHAEGYVNAGLGLLLHGTMGTGKTLLSTLLLRRMVAEGHDVFLTTFQKLIDHYTDGWRDKTLATWFASRIRNVSVLGIDDLGRENKARIDVVEAMLDELLRARVAAGRPTIITTNLSLDSLRTTYRANIMSLLTESVIKHEFAGGDYRPTAAEDRQREARLGLRRPIVIG